MLAIDHVSVVVKDLTASVNFYTQILGCHVVRTVDNDSAQFGAGIGMPGARARGVHVAPEAGRPTIELFQFVTPAPGHSTEVPQPNTLGIRHVCFEVEDMKSVHERLRARGVEFIGPPTRVDTPAEVAGVEFCYFRDPDGNILELRRPPDHERRSTADVSK